MPCLPFPPSLIELSQDPIELHHYFHTLNKSYASKYILSLIKQKQIKCLRLGEVALQLIGIVVRIWIQGYRILECIFPPHVKLSTSISIPDPTVSIVQGPFISSLFFASSQPPALPYLLVYSILLQLMCESDLSYYTQVFIGKHVLNKPILTKNILGSNPSVWSWAIKCFFLLCFLIYKIQILIRPISYHCWVD